MGTGLAAVGGGFVGEEGGTARPEAVGDGEGEFSVSPGSGLGCLLCSRQSLPFVKTTLDQSLAEDEGEEKISNAAG